jgi:hypothetical protein
MADSIRVTGDSPTEWKADLVGRIDDRIKNPGKSRFVTFDIQGDGKFKVRNTVESLREFKKKVKGNRGFYKAAIKPHGKEITDKGSNARLVDSFIEERDYANAYEAAKLSKYKPIIRDMRKKTTDKPTYGMARNVKEFEVFGHKFAVGKYTEGGKTYYRTFDLESGYALGMEDRSAAKAEASARDQVKSKGKETLDRAMKQARKERSYDKLDEGFRAQHFPEDKKKGKKGGGLGGKQGGEVNLGDIADGIKDMAKTAKHAAKLATHAPVSLAKSVTRTWFRAPMSVIRDLDTPTAIMLADIMHKPRTVTDGKVRDPDIIERAQVREGEYIHELDRVIEPLRNRLGNVPKKLNDDIFSMLVDDLDLTPKGRKLLPGKVGKGTYDKKKFKAAQDIRKWLDHIGKEIVDTGIDINLSPNYFPRIWDASKIAWRQGLPNVESFAEFLVNNAKVDGKPIDIDMAQRITQNILENDGYHDNGGFGYRDPQVEKAESPTSKHFMARKIEIPDKAAKDWMVTDISAVLSKYGQVMANRIEYAKTFGPNGKKLGQMVSDISKEYNKTRGSSMQVKDIEPFIRTWSEAYLGRYGAVNNIYGKGFVRAVNNFEVLTCLPMVTFTSLAEFGPISGLGGYRVAPAALKTIINGINNSVRKGSRLVTGKTRLEKTELQETLERMGHYTIQAFNHAQTSRFSGTGGKLTSAMMKYNLHDMLTNFQRSLTHQIAIDIVNSAAKRLSKEKEAWEEKHGSATKASDILRGGKGAKGKWDKSRLGQDYERQLIEMGIDPEAAIDWFRGGMKDKAFTNHAHLSSIGTVNRIIQRPNASISPNWVFSERLSWLALFKKFTLSFQNTYIPKMLSEIKEAKSFRGKTQYLMGAMIGTGIAYAIMEMKDHLYWGGAENNPYRGKMSSPESLMLEAVDRAGFTGALTFPLAVFKPRYGFWESGEQRIINLMGPGAVDISAVIGLAISEEGQGSKKAARWVSRKIPTPFYIAADIGDGEGASVKRKKLKGELEGIFQDIGGGSGLEIGKGFKPKRSGWGSGKSSGWGSGKSSGW